MKAQIFVLGEPEKPAGEVAVADGELTYGNGRGRFSGEAMREVFQILARKYGAVMGGPFGMIFDDVVFNDCVIVRCSGDATFEYLSSQPVSA